MRAVWSFWSAPFRTHYHRTWYSDKHHLLSWVLSVAQARRHYTDTCLVTDSEGASVLVDELRLPFRHIDTSLDSLEPDAHDDAWWVLGKLTAYAAQTQPFVHIDNDVFLWDPLPGAMTSAPVFAQNPEVFYFEDQSLYRVDAFMRGIERFGGWLPREWWWYAQRRGNGALCCGVLGGQCPEFIRHYARSAIDVVLHPRNQTVWPTLGVRDNILVEQYFLTACVEFHRGNLDSPFPGVEVAHLFPSSGEAFDPKWATRLGYTHLLGEAKRDPVIAERLERRVQREHPALYRRCLAHLDRHRRLPPVAN